MEANGFIIEMGTPNLVQFTLPEAALSTNPYIYVAAISFRWQQSCGAPFRAGVINPIFVFGGTDPRAIPLASDSLFWGSVAVISPGPSPLPTPPGFINNLSPTIGISGFQGVLGATGTASGLIDLTNFVDPLNTLGVDGLELSLAWVTFSVTDAGQVGYISQPICIRLRNPAVMPVTRVNCL
jgi:hypothetical protein